WPDKATSHYAENTVKFLTQQNIKFVPKFYNPTNLPQCRPIEDIWGQLSTLVYSGGWSTKSFKALKSRITKCFRKIDFTPGLQAFSNIRKNLRKVYRNGP